MLSKKIVFDRWLGLAPDWVKQIGEIGVRNTYPYAQDMTHIGLYGDYIQPGFKATIIKEGSPVTTKITNLTSVSVSGTAKAYGIGDDIIYELTGVGFGTVTDDGTYPHTISNVTTGKLHDCLAAYVGTTSPALCLLYTYNDSVTAGKGYCGKLTLSSDTFADTTYTLTTNAVTDDQGSLPADRPMFYAPDGKVYIGSGNVLDRIDLTQNSAPITLAVFNRIAKDYKIRSIGWYKSHLVITTEKNVNGITTKGDVKVYFWDTFSPTPDEVYNIPADKAGAIWNDNDETFLFARTPTIGASAIGIFKFTETDFDLVQTCVGNVPEHGSIDTYKNGFVFSGSGRNGGNQNEIYGYFSPSIGTPRQLSSIIAEEGTVSCVKNIYPTNGRLHTCGDDGNNKYVHYTDSTCDFFSGTYILPTVHLGHKAVVRRVTFYHQSPSSGVEFRISYAPNYSDSYTTYDTIEYTADGVRQTVSNKIIPDVNSITWRLQWIPESGTAAVRLHRMEIEYTLNPNASAS